MDERKMYWTLYRLFGPGFGTRKVFAFLVTDAY